ncbi:MAG: helix-turn-helix domain-containing protein [Bacteroidota bacterium]
MNIYKDVFYSEAAQEFIKEIKSLVLKGQRPPEEIILDETDLCDLLNISKRHAADLRKEGVLKYSKIGGKLFYLLSDVLDMIKNYRIDIPTNNLKLKI